MARRAECPPTVPVDPEDGIDGAWQWRGGWQRWVFPSVWLIYLGQTLGGIGKHSDGFVSLVGIVVLVAFSVCYLIGLPIGAAGERRTWLAIAVLVGLTIVEVPIAHEDALVMCVFIAVLAMARGGRSGPLFVAAMTLVVVALPALVPSWHTGADWDMLVTIPLVACAMYGFFTIIRSARELATAHAEVVRLAAENERTRIARDLHDVLGHSLTTITVKSALAGRLITRDPARAAQEIGDVEGLSRSTLSDVRAAVAGYRDVTLAGELATARHVLRSAGIAAHLPGAIDAVPGGLHELFGWTVREGVTNVVRHARATSCTITLGADSGGVPGTSWLQIDDDGRETPTIPAARPGAGVGLVGLRERASLAGGTLTSGPTSTGWTLRVDVHTAQVEPRTTPSAVAGAHTAVPGASAVEPGGGGAPPTIVRVAPSTTGSAATAATRTGPRSPADGG